MLKNGRDQLKVSILGRCRPYRESKDTNEESRGQNLGVHFSKVSAL